MVQTTSQAEYGLPLLEPSFLMTPIKFIIEFIIEKVVSEDF
jgi:hypothetical protein